MKCKIFQKPVINSKATGDKIKYLRQKSGYSVHEIQNIFGFDYPQAVYFWEQGKNIPTIDNLLILSKLFNTPVEEILICYTIPTKVSCQSDNKFCNPQNSDLKCNNNCDKCMQIKIA